MRSTIIAGLFVVELAIIGEAVVAVQAGQTPAAISGPHLIEDGPHQLFTVGAHPSLNIDIGYADLTIVTGTSSQIDVALSASTTGGFFEETAPIVARADGDAVRVASNDRSLRSGGDNRMLTVVVPPETIVNVLKAGDVKLRGLRGETTVNTVGNGSIAVNDFAGPTLDLTTDGPVTMRQVITTHLDVKCDDSVDGSGITANDGSIQADDKITLGFAPGASTVVNAHASDGKIEAAGFAAPDSTAKSDDDNDSSSKTIRVGGGSGNLDVKSDDGNITLSQES